MTGGRMSNLDQRRFERFRIEPMYSSVSVRTSGDLRAGNVEGHLYEVSEAGARLEVDAALAPGTSIALAMRLPGVATSIFVSGRVVWCADDDDDPGACRVGVCFTEFGSSADRAQLGHYLGSGYARRAA